MVRAVLLGAVAHSHSSPHLLVLPYLNNVQTYILKQGPSRITSQVPSLSHGARSPVIILHILFQLAFSFPPPDDRNLLDFKTVVAYQIKTALLLKKNNEIT